MSTAQSAIKVNADKVWNYKSTMSLLSVPVGVIAIIVISLYLASAISINDYYASRYLSEIEYVKEKVNQIVSTENGSGNIKSMLEAVIKNHNVNGIRIAEKGVVAGSLPSDDEIYSTIVGFDLHAIGKNNQNLHVELFLPSIDSYLVLQNMSLVVLIVLTLASVIFVCYCYASVLLRQAFLPIMNVANRFAKGHYNARFNENGNDIIASAARMLNHALDKIVADKRKLEKINSLLVQEERELCLSKESAEIALRAYGDAVITLNSNYVIEFANKDAEAIVGYDSASMIGFPFSDRIIIVDADGAEIDILIELTQVDERVETQNIGFLQRMDARSVEILYVATAIRDHDECVIGYTVILEDISPKRRVGRKLQFKTFYDELTGLFNSRSLELYLEAFIQDSKESNAEHAFLVIDVNQYMEACNVSGQVYADELLADVARIIEENIRDTDVLCRLKSGKLGLLIPYCPMGKARSIAKTFYADVCGSEITIKGTTYAISLNVGICIIDRDSISKDEVIASAEFACRRSSEAEHAQDIYVYEYDLVEIESQRDEHKWVKKLTRAIQENLFTIMAQPIFYVSSPDKASISHYELLIRLPDAPNDSDILPNDFISVAESYFMMPAIDRWMISNSFAALQNVQETISININLSGQSLSDPGFVDFVIQQVENTGIDPTSICFEITETSAISNLDNAISVISRLKRYGFRFALDDFGSGVSSFGYLQNFDVDYIKIDGSFISGIDNNSFNQAFVKAICDVANVLQIMTIAEYVDTQHVYNFLKGVGVNFAQGHYLGEPAPLAQSIFTHSITRRNSSC